MLRHITSCDLLDQTLDEGELISSNLANVSISMRMKFRARARIQHRVTRVSRETRIFS